MSHAAAVRLLGTAEKARTDRGTIEHCRSVSAGRRPGMIGNILPDLAMTLVLRWGMPGRYRTIPDHPEAYGYIPFGPALPPMTTTRARPDAHNTITPIDTACAAKGAAWSAVGEHARDQGIYVCRVCCPMVTVLFRDAVLGACARVSEV